MIKEKTTLLQWATLAVALGPVGENGLAHLGLSAHLAEIGEFPHSSLARGSPVDSVRPAASGWGRRYQGASPGGEGSDLGHKRRRSSPWWARGGGEPATAGQRRGGEHQLGVRGPAVSSGGGCYGDGGERRWPEVALNGRAASATEGGGQLSASTVACSGWWLNGRLGVA
jgi:hypothetical protein